MAEVPEEKDPLDLLHEDEWREVVKFLDDPRDLLNVASTCRLFECILQPFLLCEERPSELLRLEEVVPLLLKWLPINKILELRLVCRRIGRRVDKHLAEEPRLVIYNNLDLYPNLIPPRTLASPSFEYQHFKLPYLLFKGITFGERWSFDDLQKLDVDLSEGRKIIGWKITINMSDLLEKKLQDEEDEDEVVRLEPLLEADFLDKTIELFSKYPGQIRHLDLLTEHLGSYMDIYELVRRLIQSLPNLCVFILKYWRIGANDQDEINRRIFLPLPVCSSLETMYFGGYFPEVFVRQLGGVYGGHLKSLRVAAADNTTFTLDEEHPMSDDELAFWGGVQPVDFAALQYLEMLVKGESFLFLSRMNAPHLKILDLELALILKSGESLNAPELEIAELINVLVSFPSINQLIFKVSWSYSGEPGAVMEELHQKQEHLQNLKTLELHVPHGPFNVPLKFWTGLCPNLEEIEVVGFLSKEYQQYFKPSSETPDQDLILLLGRRFEESRMWQESPNLMWVKWRDCTGGYLYHILRAKGNNEELEVPYKCRRPPINDQ